MAKETAQSVEYLLHKREGLSSDSPESTGKVRSVCLSPSPCPVFLYVHACVHVYRRLSTGWVVETGSSLEFVDQPV